MGAPYVMSDEIGPESQLPHEPPPPGAPPPAMWQLFPETLPDSQAPIHSQMTGSTGSFSSMLPPGLPVNYRAAPPYEAPSPESPIPQRRIHRLDSPLYFRTDCNVGWSFYVPAAAPQALSTSSTSSVLTEKRKKAPTYQHIVPYGPPLYVSLLQGTSLDDFKEYVIVVMAKKLDTLGMQAAELNASGSFTWTAYIDRGGGFAMGQNRKLVNDADLEEFRVACGKAVGKKIGVKLLMRDPMKCAQDLDEEAAMKKALLLSNGPVKERRILQDEVDRVIANGNADCDRIMDLGAELVEEHTNNDARFPSETAVIVKPGQGPADPVLYLELGFNMSYDWATRIHADRHKVDGVSKVNLPDTKAFKAWKTLGSVRAAPETPGINAPFNPIMAPGAGGFPHFPYGGYNPYAALGLPGLPAGCLHQQNAGGTPAMPGSPTKSERHAVGSPTPEADEPLNGFLSFARVNLEDQEMRELIVHHKITHYFFFEGSTVDELRGMGFAFGQARLLVRASKLYSAYLRLVAKRA